MQMSKARLGMLLRKDGYAGWQLLERLPISVFTRNTVEIRYEEEQALYTDGERQADFEGLGLGCVCVCVVVSACVRACVCACVYHDSFVCITPPRTTTLHARCLGNMSTCHTPGLSSSKDKTLGGSVASGSSLSTDSTTGAASCRSCVCACVRVWSDKHHSLNATNTGLKTKRMIASASSMSLLRES